MKTGSLVISLDFELYWGIGDHIVYNQYKDYFDNTLKAIPEILDLYSNYGIHCTWATVGMLWNESWEEWQKNILSKLPDYNNPKLCNYLLDEKIIFKNVNEKHFFALDLINKIKTTKGQEIGTHTYSHYYCNEENRSLEALADDLKKASEIASKTQTNLESLVLPRNQFVKETLKTIQSNGIKSVRVNPDVWFWSLLKQNKLSSRVARLVDSYSSIFKVKSYSWKKLKFQHDVLLQPASRFLRPINKKLPFLNKIRIARIKKEMTYAAKNNEIYHLWWHPHNFALEPKLAIKELVVILEHYQYLKDKYEFKSMNMGDVLIAFKKHE